MAEQTICGDSESQRDALPEQRPRAVDLSEARIRPDHRVPLCCCGSSIRDCGFLCIRLVHGHAMIILAMPGDEEGERMWGGYCWLCLTCEHGLAAMHGSRRSVASWHQEHRLLSWSNGLQAMPGSQSVFPFWLWRPRLCPIGDGSGRPAALPVVEFDRIATQLDSVCLRHQEDISIIHTKQ